MPPRPWPIHVDPKDALSDSLRWMQVSRDQAIRAESMGALVAVAGGSFHGASRFDETHPAYLASGPYLYASFRYYVSRGSGAASVLGPSRRPAGGRSGRSPAPKAEAMDSEELVPLEEEPASQPPPAQKPARATVAENRKQPSEGVLHFDIALDPASEKAKDDTFHLEGLDSAYSQVRTVKDDKVSGDGKLTLVFTGVEPGRRYTLLHRQGEDEVEVVLVPSVTAPPSAAGKEASAENKNVAREGDVVGMKAVFRECRIRYEREDLWKKQESEYAIEIAPIAGKWVYVFGGPQGEKPVLIAEGVGISGGKFRPVDLRRHRGKNLRPPLEQAHEWITLPLKVNGKPWTLYACLSPIQLAWKRIDAISANPLPRCYKIGEAHGGLSWVPGRMERKAPQLLGTRDPRIADPGEDAVLVGLIDHMAEAKRRAELYQKHVEPYIAGRFDMPELHGKSPVTMAHRRRKYAAGILTMLLETHPDKARLRNALADKGQGLEAFLRGENEKELALKKKADSAGAALVKWLDPPNGLFETVLRDYAADPEVKEQWEEVEEDFAFLVRHFDVSSLTRLYGRKVLARKDSWVNRCLLNEDFHGAVRSITQASVEILSWIGKVMVSQETFDLKMLERAYGLYVPGIRFERRAFSSLEYKSLVADFFPDERVKRPPPAKVKYWEALEAPGYRREIELLWLSKDSVPMRKLAQAADSRLTKALLFGLEGVNVLFVALDNDGKGSIENDLNLVGAGTDFLAVVLEVLSVCGKKAGRGLLSALGAFSAGIDAYLSLKTAVHEHGEGDYDAMASQLAIAAGSTSLMVGSASIAFSIYSSASMSSGLLTTLFTAGGSLSMTGVGMPLASILCLAGLVAIAAGAAHYPSPQDIELEGWVRRCPWGKEPSWSFENDKEAPPELGKISIRLFPWTLKASHSFLFGKSDYRVTIQGPFNPHTKITVHALDLMDEDMRYTRFLQDTDMLPTERSEVKVFVTQEAQWSVTLALNDTVCREAHRKRFPGAPKGFKYCRIALTVDQYADGEILWPGYEPGKALILEL